MVPMALGAKAPGVEVAEFTMLAAVYDGDVELGEPWAHNGNPQASAASNGKARCIRICGLHQQSAGGEMKFSYLDPAALGSHFAANCKAFRVTVVSGIRVSMRMRRQQKPFGAAGIFPVNTVMV